MSVAALEALSAVAEHQRTRRHQCEPDRRPILEAAGEHDRDGVPRMLFFEGTIIRARGADDVGDRPGVTGRDDSG
jgi:hypothetical protein